jgi:hypothetical protein
MPAALSKRILGMEANSEKFAVRIPIIAIAHFEVVTQPIPLLPTLYLGQVVEACPGLIAQKAI